MENSIQNQYADSILEAIGVIAVEDKPSLVDMLKRNGSFVNEGSSTSEIIDSALKTLKENSRFREDLKDYLVMAFKTNGDSISNSFSNAGGEGWKKVKNAFGSIFTEENISQLAGVGIGYLSARITANAQKGTNQQAIDFERAKAESASAEAMRLENLAKVGSQQQSTQGGRKKWVLPIAIGGGILLIGTILFVALRKK